MKKFVIWLLTVVFLISILFVGVGCKATTTETTAAAETTAVAETTATSASTEEVYVWASVLTEITYFIDHKLGLDAASKELGVKTKIIGPVEYDIQAMIVAIEQEIPNKPAGMMIIGWDKALESTINQILEAGIPVVTLDADVATSNRLIFIGTGNYGAGFAGGEMLAKAIGEKGKVALLSSPTLSNLMERERGYKDALAQYPDIEVVTVADDGSDIGKSAQAAAGIMGANPDLAGFGCVGSEGGKGVAAAVKEAGKAGTIKIVSMDRDVETLDFIKNGVIDATVVQKSALMSYLGVKFLYDLNHNPVAIVDDNKAANVTPLPAMVDTGTIIVDKNNVDYFYHK